MPRQIYIRIEQNTCHACRRCLVVKACKMHAIVQIDPSEPPYLDGTLCRDCRICLPACPFGAIQVVRGV